MIKQPIDDQADTSLRDHQPGDATADAVHPVIRRYVAGEMSALRAAAALGDNVSVSDVIMMIKAAGLEPPRQSPEAAQAELARARLVLGLTGG